MHIKTGISYNLDLLCFFNVMTADEYYTKRHHEGFDAFYPRISESNKRGLRAMTDAQGYTMLAPVLTLMISSLPDFQKRSLADMLSHTDEIEAAIQKTPYCFEPDELTRYLAWLENTVFPMIIELESIGFGDYWTQMRLPAIQAKSAQVDRYMERIRLDELIRKYKLIDDDPMTIYLCSFAAPHGIKLCGSNLISDISYSDETILSNVTHEVFHPPYQTELVRASLQKLAEKPWMKRAFATQNPNSGYHSMEGFIEEHVVEALGIHVLMQLGSNIDPLAYFRTHDDGSHVLSPYLFTYLQSNPKPSAQRFEDYFNRFVDELQL